MEAKPKGDGLEQFRKWLTPLLILITGYFMGRKLDEIDKKMELITVVSTAQEVMKVELTNIKSRVDKLEDEGESRKRIEAEAIYKAAERHIKK